VVRSKGDKATYIGHELERCRDFASLKYRMPIEKASFIYVYPFLGSRPCLSNVGLHCRLGRAEGSLGRAAILPSVRRAHVSCNRLEHELILCLGQPFGDVVDDYGAILQPPKHPGGV
jgi:hypothetical protein